MDTGQLLDGKQGFAVCAALLNFDMEVNVTSYRLLQNQYFYYFWTLTNMQHVVQVVVLMLFFSIVFLAFVPDECDFLVFGVSTDILMFIHECYVLSLLL